MGEIPGSVEDTIDTLKVGDPKREVTGVVTTFLATFDVLKKTKEIGANLVLTHEPTGITTMISWINLSVTRYIKPSFVLLNNTKSRFGDFTTTGIWSNRIP